MKRLSHSTNNFDGVFSIVNLPNELRLFVRNVQPSHRTDSYRVSTRVDLENKTGKYFK